MDLVVLEMVTYHGIALGFIAMSLQIHPDKGKSSGDMTGAKSGALIVSSYLIQAIAGLMITLFLAYTFMPDLFKAAGILLPMGYGQGRARRTTSAVPMRRWDSRRAELRPVTGGFRLSRGLHRGRHCPERLIRRGRVQRIRHDEISGSVTVETFRTQEKSP
jgi:ESS family glutamate:Na+ symporter